MKTVRALLAVLFLLPIGVTARADGGLQVPPATFTFSGDCTGTGSFTVTIQCTKLNGIGVGVSGAAIPLLSTANTWSLLQTFVGGIAATGGNIGHTFNAAVSAAGTTLATATALAADINAVTTVTSGSGVSLKAFVSTNGIVRQEVINAGANALLVYPPAATAAIWNLNGSAAAGTVGAAVSLAVGTHAVFECMTATLCYEAP